MRVLFTLGITSNLQHWIKYNIYSYMFRPLRMVLCVTYSENDQM